MKLKEIPNGAVVHTPTEEEAKKLLAILYENGYKWLSGHRLIGYTEWKTCQENTVYCINGPKKNVGRASLGSYPKAISLAEFKEKHALNEDNFAKSEELDLSKLLKDHQGETFFSPCFGDMKLYECDYDSVLMGEGIGEYKRFRSDGRYCGSVNALPSLFPSRELYLKYPLNAKKAWDEWEETQTKPYIEITIGDELVNGDTDYFTEDRIYFYAASDRDKCVEEINKIVDKYKR